MSIYKEIYFKYILQWRIHTIVFKREKSKNVLIGLAMRFLVLLNGLI